MRIVDRTDGERSLFPVRKDDECVLCRAKIDPDDDIPICTSNDACRKRRDEIEVIRRPEIEKRTCKGCGKQIVLAGGGSGAGYCHRYRECIQRIPASEHPGERTLSGRMRVCIGCGDASVAASSKYDYCQYARDCRKKLDSMQQARRTERQRIARRNV